MSTFLPKKVIAQLVAGTFFIVLGAQAVAATTQSTVSSKTHQVQQVPQSLEMLSRDNTVLVLVDHQIGLFTGVRDIPVADLKHNVVALAKAAKVLGIPVIMTATMPDGLWGPTIPELTSALPDVPIITRTVINAWDDPAVRAAIEKTGRKQILIAGVSLEVCAAFPAIAAKAAQRTKRPALCSSSAKSDGIVGQ